MVYIIDRIEHGNGGVCGTNILAELPLKEALKKTPYTYGCGNKMFGFYPVICGKDKNANNPLYTWDDEFERWEKVNRPKKINPTNINGIRLTEIDLSKLKGCEHPDISPIKDYLVVYNKSKIIGRFDKQWYGWSFDWFWGVSSLQINSLEKVYEIEYL